MSKEEPKKKKKNLAIHLMAGGVAGCCEALACHPLDTIKVRLQLRGERSTKSSIAGQALHGAASEIKVTLISIKNSPKT